MVHFTKKEKYYNLTVCLFASFGQSYCNAGGGVCLPVIVIPVWCLLCCMITDPHRGIWGTCVTDSRVWRVLDWRLTVQLLSATLFLFTIWEWRNSVCEFGQSCVALGFFLLSVFTYLTNVGIYLLIFMDGSHFYLRINLNGLFCLVLLT